MSVSENRQSSPSEGLQIPGLVQDQQPVEQLSFTVNPATPTPLPAPTPSQNGPESSSGLADFDTARRPVSQAGFGNSPISQPISSASLYGPESSPDLADFDTAQRPVSQAGFEGTGGANPPSQPGSTRALLLASQPGITQALAEAHSTSNTASLRPPVVIRGNGQKGGTRSLRPPQGRRHVIGIAALVLLLVITGGTLFAVSPMGRDIGLSPGSQPSGSNLIQGTPEGNLKLVAQQATATAVVHQQNDGYVPGSGGAPIVTGGPHSWPVGVCTYWANSRYHALTGNWVTWLGNAYQWVDGARAAGWNVSTSPHVPSIIVLMPGVQGASGYGHVAVVESASGNVAHTSNMNWYANGGGWDIVSYYDFTAGSGVYFIWK